jgi:hypothetical protein
MAEEEELEGIFVGDDLFLRGKASDNVYSATRDDLGELIRVGQWVDGEAHLDPEPSAVAPVAAAAPTPACPKAVAEVDYPFEVHADDHCETPPEAFGHIAAVLSELAAHTGVVPAAKLRIWDPYYCSGSSAIHLETAGFPTCHHRKEDFYAVVEKGAQPEHDVVVTNPPFSADHIPRFLEIAAANAKPWCMLAPNWVYTKPFFASVPPGVFYVVPTKRYRFLPPRGARSAKASDTHKRTSPFPCFWFCGGFPPALIPGLLSKVVPEVMVARATSQLPFHALADYDPRRKKMRSAMKRKRKRGPGSNS